MVFSHILKFCKQKPIKNWKYWYRSCKKLHFNGVKFPVHRKYYTKIEKKIILINVFGYEDETTYCNYTLKQSFEINVDLLLLSISENSHFVLIRYFNRFVTNTTKNHC